MPRIYRLAPVLLSLLFSATTQAQTYFYVDDISVYPGTPTDQQVVEVQLSGNLSNTGSYVTSVTADVTGFDVSITVEAGSNGGLAVLVPHLESVFTGPLPAGTYTITIGGSGVLDSAPGSQHAFTVTGSAATACDSLILANVQWSPFSDSLLTVHVFNSTSTLFDYPGFILLDGNGDTLAQEVVNYFGLGFENWNSLTVSPEAELPTGTFNGTLELWTGFYEDLACSWELPVTLCPDELCSAIVPFIQNYGSGFSLGDFQYDIRSDGMSVASGMLTLTAEEQFASDTVCLPPGNYEIELTAEQPSTGGQAFFGVGGDSWPQGPNVQVDYDTPATMPFTFFGPCIDIAQGITTPQANGLTVTQSEVQLRLQRADGQAIGSVQVFDTQGRTVHATRDAQRECKITTGEWPAGIYILRATNGTKTETVPCVVQ
jgi:hypothetical protein